jgi:ribosomal peptide maturation radical SAM protein 1
MKIALLTMPFSTPTFPALGLSQIKGRLKDVFGDKVKAEVLYLHHDFYEFFGQDFYSMVDRDSTYTLVNDWLFRHEAFDDIEVNYKEYLERFYPNSPFIGAVSEKVLGLSDYIEELIDQYNLTSYDVVGVSGTFTVTPGLAFCRHLKLRNPEIKTVIGGAAVYHKMGHALSKYYPHLDYVCSGCGLSSFPQWVERLMENDTEGMDSIDGMLSRTNNGKVKIVSDVLDINTKVSLEYYDFFERFNNFGSKYGFKPTILLETSRGCSWNKCKFCGLNEDQLAYTQQSVEKTVDEINFFLKEYDCDIQMVDNVMPRQYVKRVLPKIENPNNRILMYEVLANYREDEMKAMSEAQVRRIQPGIEALTTSVHRLMDKGVNIFQCLHMLKLAIKYGIYVSWNIIVGFPGMTADMYESLAEIVPQLTHLNPPGVLTPVRFDRFSEYWSLKDKYNLELSPFAAYSYVYPYDKEFLNDFAYYFEDANFDSERIYAMAEHYSKCETLVTEWQNRWREVTMETIPQLNYQRENGSIRIFDSRSRSPKHYNVSDLEDRVLTVLDAPKNTEVLMNNLEGDDKSEVMDTLDSLVERDLVFEENDKYMSLVIRDSQKSSYEFLVNNLY